MRSFGRRKRNSSSRRWNPALSLGGYPCRREACREVTCSSIGGGGILLRCAGSFLEETLRRDLQDRHRVPDASDMNLTEKTSETPITIDEEGIPGTESLNEARG